MQNTPATSSKPHFNHNHQSQPSAVTYRDVIGVWAQGLPQAKNTHPLNSCSCQTYDWNNQRRSLVPELKSAMPVSPGLEWLSIPHGCVCFRQKAPSIMSAVHRHHAALDFVSAQQERVASLIFHRTEVQRYCIDRDDFGVAVKYLILKFEKNEWSRAKAFLAVANIAETTQTIKHGLNRTWYLRTSN